MMKLFQVVLAAVLLLASPFAFAGKPSKDQEINTGPVWQGNVLGCYVSNLTGTPIIVDITIIYYDLGTKTTIYELFPTREIESDSVDHVSLDPTSHNGGYCKINWTGEIGQLRGTACSFQSDSADNVQFLGCSDAY